MAQNGGVRPGAGRPKGAKVKRTQELIAKAVEGGITPMEVLLNDMRQYHGMVQEELTKLPEIKDEKERADKSASLMKLQALARECAIAAAPYMHPKLSSVDAKVTVKDHEAALRDLKK